jgi:(1->4)-alpha-D-glucan 1-alpha-D-glucosylmutase
MVSPLAPARATYRLQATPEFGFDRIAELASYLAELGVSHAYLSPVLTAASGSQHGYDVIDHDHVNPELGGDTAHARMCDALRAHGIGQLIDIVPNHMAIVAGNRLWWDVLENGPSSHYAAFFDVDWEGGEDTRVLLPILGEHYFDELRERHVKVVRSGAEFIVEYYDNKLPAAPRSLGAILRASAPEHNELCYLADSLEELSAPTATDQLATHRRQRDKAVLFDYLARLLEREPELCARIDTQLEKLTADVEALDSWLERQNWRLAHWRNATTDLGYRRFFDVNSLAGLRIENVRVFERVHHVVLKWLAQGTIDGVRVDHVDGLRDPHEYLQRLREAAPDAWIVVEKILAENEPLPRHWPIEGTTGYEFIRTTDQLFVDSQNQAKFDALDARYSGETGSWEERVREAKLLILKQVLGSERERITDLAQRVLTRRIELRDATRKTLSSAVTELLISYPVYRTYVRMGSITDHDRSLIDQVLAKTQEIRPEIDARVIEGLSNVLSLQWAGELETELALRVQQLTGAIMAKSIEDTLFYRHVRLTALNEVGGSPEVFGISVDDFHKSLESIDKPRGLLASATHDTKRGEDTRARLLALSEIPERWEQAVSRWSELTKKYRSSLIDGATEYFFYQTLLGAYPLTEERALAYMQKATREAKRSTSWIQPEPEYEAALESFIKAAIADKHLQGDVAQLVASISPGAYITALARTLIKLTAPGVPDVYQGTELWDFSLVDPDNRRPVDYAERRSILEQVKKQTPENVLAEMERGTPKLWLTWKTLQLRKQRPEAFEGQYQRLQVTGADAEHVVAFARDRELVTVVPRLNQDAQPKQRQAQVRLPEGRYRNVLTGESVTTNPCQVSQLWGRFPVALLIRET